MSDLHGGNTGLHEAVRNSQYDVVKLLLEKDPEMADGKDSDGKSPLYIAAEKGDHEIIELIFRICTSPSYDGPEQRTALHAAALSNSADCMKQILVEMHVDTTEMADVFGFTALHYAAKFGYTELVNLLLSKNKCIAYIVGRNGDSETALHLAVIEGHLDVVRQMLLHCPDCMELKTGKRKNVLHLAVENEKVDVLEFLLDNPFACELINKTDGNGNTPLHLYAATETLDGYGLVNHPCADRNAFNNDNMTPLDMAMDAGQVTERQTSTKEVLVKAGATAGLRDAIGKFHQASLKTKTVASANPRPVQYILTKKPLSKVQDVMNGSDGVDENEKNEHTKTCLVIAALIVTVTFAAGFTIPGGFSDTEGKEGLAILQKRKAFTAFVVTNSLALILAIGELLQSIFFKDILEGQKQVVFLAYSMPLMEMAFSTGLYVTLQETSLKIYIIVTGSVVALTTFSVLAIVAVETMDIMFSIYIWRLQVYAALLRTSATSA